MASIAELKRDAGRRAVEFVEDGMSVGLGSGSTAREFVRALAERLQQEDLTIRAVASSEGTEKLAGELGIPLVEHEEPLDLAIDGADAVERDTLAAIKGLGGALVREKLIAQAAVRFVLVVDESKVYTRFTQSHPDIPVPVEVLPFGWKLTHQRLAHLGNPVLRERSDEPFISDNGNLILDLYGCDFQDVLSLAQQIKVISGVVDHGLFCNLVTDAVVAKESGIEILRVR
ncbi:MAG: ribose-5-phosphate isomerase RpiA [Chloroflexota bacterium]